MKKKTVVIAIGGNAMIRKGEKGAASEQFANVERTCRQIVDMIDLGYKVILTHGNGPQVGNILLQNEAGKTKGVPSQPLDVCVSESQGQIGYILQQTLENQLRKRKKRTQVVTMVTQVLVDKKDPAFKKPTKPIGTFYTEKQARSLMRKLGWDMMEDAGRGWRRVVPSPMPMRTIERRAVKKLIRQDAVVIAAGGGGIPVILERNRLKGIEAVIDKDLASSVLAANIDAQMLIILTDVEQVALNYGTPDEERLEALTMKEAEKYYEEGHFPPGSMGPKMLAAINFVKRRKKGQVLITSTDTLLKGLKGDAGTRIFRSDVEKKKRKPEPVDEDSFKKALNI